MPAASSSPVTVVVTQHQVQVADEPPLDAIIVPWEAQGGVGGLRNVRNAHDMQGPGGRGWREG